MADVDDAAKDEDGTGAVFVAPLPSVLLPTLTTFSPVARLRLMLLVDAAVTMGRFVGGISIWFYAPLTAVLLGRSDCYPAQVLPVRWRRHYVRTTVEVPVFASLSVVDGGRQQHVVKMRKLQIFEFI